jgi:hypothetical protein
MRAVFFHSVLEVRWSRWLSGASQNRHLGAWDEKETGRALSSVGTHAFPLAIPGFLSGAAQTVEWEPGLTYQRLGSSRDQILPTQYPGYDSPLPGHAPEKDANFILYYRVTQVQA